MRVRLATRKHRVGVARVIAAIASAHTVQRIRTDRGEEAMMFIGWDARGRELEVIAIDRGDELLVVHAMPVDFRDGGRGVTS